MGLCGKSRAEVEKEELEDEKKAIAKEKKAMEESIKALEREKKAMEEAKKALEQEKKALEEKKRALEEQKRALDGEKESIESEKKAVDQERRAVEEEKKVLEGEKRGIEEERKVTAEIQQETAVTTRALVHEEEAAQTEEGKAEEEEKEEPPTPEFAAPDWLDVALIQKALENGGDDRQVEDISVAAGTAPGDNYASSIYRVRVKLAGEEETSLLVKGPAGGQATADMMDGLNVFKTEAFMLGEVVPKMEALLEAAAPGRFPPLAARCPLHGDSPANFLVLEDLRPAGFKMADRKRGLGLNHSLLAVRTLARFHAASHALLKKEPEVAQRLPNPWATKNPVAEEIGRMGIQATADACRAWGGMEEIADLLEKCKPSAMQMIADACEPKADAFNVISHADFWVNNIMFRYEDGVVTDIRVVDLQASTVVSPALDILYFLSTSLSENVSTYYQDLLVREYHHALQENLALLGMEAPSLQELLAAIDHHGPFSLMGTMSVIPVVKADKPMDLELLAQGYQAAMAPLMESPLVKRWLQRVLPELVRKGWLRA